MRADRALELSRRFSAADTHDDNEVAQFLLDSAVHAYWLCFSKSGARVPMTDDDLPIELRPAQKGVRYFRNRVLAHSDSDLLKSAALSVIEKDGDEYIARPFMLATARTYPPTEFVDNLAMLIEAATEFVDVSLAATQHVAQERLSKLDLKALWEGGQKYPPEDVWIERSSDG